MRRSVVALSLAGLASAQTIYDVVNATTSVPGVFYPTITAVNAAATDSATYIETSGTGSTALTRTRIQYLSSSNSYRITQIGATVISSQTAQMTTVYNGQCTYQTSSPATGTCSDTWAYMISGQTVLVQTELYPGTVTSYVLGTSTTQTGSSGLSKGSIAAIVIAVIIIINLVAAGAWLMLRRHRQQRVRRSLENSANRRFSVTEDPFGNESAAAAGHARSSSGDAKPWGPNATYFGAAAPASPAPAYKAEHDTAAEHGTASQFSIGEDLPQDVAASIAARSPTTPRTRSSDRYSARVPVPSYYEPEDEHDIGARI